MDSIYSVISAMSANLRAACVEYFRFTDTRNMNYFDGTHVMLNDSTDLHDVLRRANLANNINMQRFAEYTDYLKKEVQLRDRRLQFIEFIIRTTIYKEIESAAHFKTLFICNDSFEICFVTPEHICTKWPYATKVSNKKQKTDSCTKYVTWLKNLLYVNQCSYNINPALTWEKLTLDNDEAQERLVCTLENHHKLLGVDREGYLILCEPIYYGSLIELPTEDFDNWFPRVQYHTDPLDQICHARYVVLYDKHYLECNYNLKAGMRFFHDL